MQPFGTMIMAAGTAFLMFLTATAAFPAQHEATAEKGRMLFNDSKLGTNGKSCNNCHAGGAGLEKAGEKKDLGAIVNNCITQGLKGTALKPSSVEMQSLILYIKAVGKEGKTKPSSRKKAPVGC